MEKILLICSNNWQLLFSSFDLVQAIKYKNNNAEIHYLTCEDNLIFCKQNEDINKIIIAKQDYVQNVFELLKENYSYVIDLQKDANSFFTRKYLRHKFNSLQTTIVFPGLFTNIKSKNSAAISEALCKKCHEIASPFNFKNYVYKSTEKLGKDDLPMAHLAGFETIVLNPKFNKTQIDKIKQLSKNSSLPIILVGTESCNELATEICKLNPVKLYNTIGKFTLEEIQEIFSRALKNWVSNCNLSYLALASGKPFQSI